MPVNFHNPAFLQIESPNQLRANIFFNELAEATLNLGRVDGSLKEIKNPGLLISPLTTKESTVSSAIEGTVSTVSDIFIYEAGGAGAYDSKVVSNYRQAIWSAQEEIQNNRPVSTHLLESMHQVLMQGVMRKGVIGRFRTDTVYLASRKNAPIQEATYVPPEALKIKDLMENWVNYANHGIDQPLVKAGLLHYQFEAIHPFPDGNGRLGRMVIPLLLCQYGILSSPVLYLSGYFESHREEYISQLQVVDQTGNYNEWLKFFFKAVAAQALETLSLINKITHLYEETLELIPSTKSPFLKLFTDFLFEAPIFTVPMALRQLPVKNRLTIVKLVKLFEAKGWIRKAFSSGRTDFYFFDRILKII